MDVIVDMQQQNIVVYIGVVVTPIRLMQDVVGLVLLVEGIFGTLQTKNKQSYLHYVAFKINLLIF